MSALSLVVGLGNPGEAYAATRHNAGRWLVERVGEDAAVRWRSERRFKASVARTTVDGGALWLLCPETYMNLSGGAVASFAAYYRIEPDAILVVHDEIDLPAGTLRLKQGGGPGGHNGLKDIIRHLGSRDFWRLRVGVGHPGSAPEVVDHVLRRPSADDRTLIDAAIDRARDHWRDIAAGRFRLVMNALHRREAPAEEGGGPDPS